MVKPKEQSTVTHPKTLLLGIHAPYNKTKNIQSYFDEFLHLAKTNQIDYGIPLFINLREVDTSYFITKGKLEDIRAFCEKEKIEEVIISETLSAKQERNLSELLGCKVFDRTQLILEIFEKTAHSGEGKLQVEIALLAHLKTRMAGKGIHMSQQGAHKLSRGPGETAKEKEKRIIDDKIIKLKRELQSLSKSRDTQRKQRLDANLAHICIIGYTNTGKSSLLNQLTKAHVLAEDKLFATLDTTTRELFIGGKKKGVISDTVGFIQQLPTLLIEAFKSTLDELRHADLLLHVIDIADANWEDHIKVVNAILVELGVNKEVLYVFNKIDLPEERHANPLEREKYQPQVLISTKSRESIAPLTDFLSTWSRQEKAPDKNN